jgi:3-deoxy-D-manno-octulosonate 8-phosphate phosphatase (KDO 8-P phosphatase)
MSVPHGKGGAKAPGVNAGAALSGPAARAARVRLMVFDVDGIMTDGRLYFDDAGREFKSFHTLDGLGMQLLRDSGVQVALLTARKSDLVARRAAELGITLVRQGAAQKLAGFTELLSACGQETSDAGFMGDDLPDLPVLVRAGFAASVPGAPEAVRSRAHYVSVAAGGNGAVREVCEFIMRSQGTLDAQLARYLD